MRMSALLERAAQGARETNAFVPADRQRRITPPITLLALALNSVGTL
jgi:hypothetical protein